MSGVGNEINVSNANWTFSGNAAKNFDEHISKSVPLYKEGHKIICDLSDFFINKQSISYELGCSTGELSLKLVAHNQQKNAQFVGIDIEADMIKVANQKKDNLKINNVDFQVDDVLQLELQHIDMITAYYTIQFIRPSQRQKLIDKIYQSLNWGGAFIFFEKVRANDARFQDITTSLYNEFKIDQGYTAEEIFTKSRSLKGILEPFSSQGNLDMLKRAGFVDIITIFKYLSFEGFLAIK
jgi:tRNA (cmo5U34)-methyltransferase